MVKGFASDFDNTLHFVDNENNGYFKQIDMKAIRRYRESGNLFGLCTGRPLYGFEGDNDEGPTLDFLIASSGGCITKTDHNSFVKIEENCISLNTVIKIQEKVDGKGVLYIHGDGHVYTFYFRRPHVYKSQTILDDPYKLSNKHIQAISIWTSSLEMASKLTKELNNEFSKDIVAYQNQNWLDVIAPNTSKGNGLLSIKKAMNIDLIAGIGDSFNDIPMLEKADVSFTFHRSDIIVQDKADYIVDNIAEALDIFSNL